MPETVAILGCGPAGLLAAHAVYLTGHNPVVFSDKVKSPILGAQYVHESIPTLTSPSPDGLVNFRKIGTREGYANRVYGNGDAPCSWDSFQEGDYPAWSMSKIYDKLWDTFDPVIHDRHLTHSQIESILSAYSLVISTIPAPVLCRGGHRFPAADVWIGQHVPENWFGDGPHHQIIYNGQGPEMGSWYRASRIFGHTAMESMEPMQANEVRGRKPLGNNCDCWPTILRVGRFGQWKKGILVHHAFRQALNRMELVNAPL